MINRIYTAGSAATTTTQSIDVRQDDTITQVLLDLTCVSVTDGDTFYVELSFLATPSQATNDTNGVIASTQLNIELTTSGAAQLGKSILIEPGTKVYAGERLYLHCVNTGTGSSKAYATVITAKDAPSNRAQSRR